VLAVFGVAGLVTPASGAGECAANTSVFAVDAQTGHLMEVAACPQLPGFGAAVTVDTSDWRVYPRIFAARGNRTGVLYAVDAVGGLWSRRQPARGAALGAPVRVGSSIDWSQPVVFAPRPGFLAVGGAGGPVRTYRHQGWESGGTTVSAELDLFSMFAGPVITGLSDFAIGAVDGTAFGVWRDPWLTHGHDDAWYPTGSLPDGVSGVVGDAVRLYGVNSDGEIVLLGQQPAPPGGCGIDPPRPWEALARAPGRYRQVVLPATGTATAPPRVRIAPVSNPFCDGSEVWPWEWQ
jgi:hypothetical protein